MSHIYDTHTNETDTHTMRPVLTLTSLVQLPSPPPLPVRLYGGGFKGGDVVEHPLLYQGQHLQHPEKEITLIFY